MRWIWIIVLSVSGCALLPDAVTAPAATQQAEVADEQVRPQARPAETPTAQGASAAAPDAPAGALGRTIASLGDAAEPGLWIKTPLVKTEGPGRVVFEQTGQSVNVTLIPIEGPATAGSRLSLAAMQALGAPLTGLIGVDVFGG